MNRVAGTVAPLINIARGTGAAHARLLVAEGAPVFLVTVFLTNGLDADGEGLHASHSTKFAVRGLGKSVALKLAPSGVRANPIHPGFISTPMTSGIQHS